MIFPRTRRRLGATLLELRYRIAAARPALRATRGQPVTRLRIILRIFRPLPPPWKPPGA